ncbi:hypothetical protein SEA_NYCEIRAE_37 [Gordonia phage Nyceirae]|uniref:Uncharacterized protein n=1 Tax=Gordonia phage Nyceirae TaxID=1887651 RepID=A0A1C9EI26_9CAUD|nr:hypothetical protein BIZ68_gp37 [Gordonia phage Nyceirae]AON97400.1 hypothetical protein SEA_NYCEIRAE_37 [Gordonia phage Nyceirae]
MADKNSGDHLLNRGPGKSAGKGGGSARYQRRQDASKKYAGKTDMGRDELFLQRMRAVPKGRRIRLDGLDQGEGDK